MTEQGLCPICKTLWNTHNEIDLDICRTIIEIHEILQHYSHGIYIVLCSPTGNYAISMN